MIPDLTVEPFSRTTTRGSGLLYDLIQLSHPPLSKAVCLDHSPGTRF
jgi:hypothetical protein